MPHGSDWLLIALSVLAIGYPLWDFDEFIYRAALPNLTDQILGALTISLVLEATRRTTGWILPVVALVFLAYAWLGPWLPPPSLVLAYPSLVQDLIGLGLFALAVALQYLHWRSAADRMSPAH